MLMTCLDSCKACFHVIIRIISCLVLVGIQFDRVYADSIIPDPRLGIVESYQSPSHATKWDIGWDRIVFEWYKIQPFGVDSWLPVRPHGLASNGLNVMRKDKGIFEHSFVQEQWIDQALDDNREIVALLIGTPDWATDGLPHRGVPNGLYLPVNDPNNHWAQFVRGVFNEYGDVIKNWVIWNEPDISSDHPGAQFDGSVEDYYRLVKVAYLVSQEVNSDIVIHLAGLTHWHDVVYGREPYLQRLLEVLVQDPQASLYDHYFDVVTVHIYFNTESVYQIINLQFDILAKFGLDKKIWLNETNAAPMNDPLYPWTDPLLPITLQQQASFVIQSNALAFASGAERVAVYKFFDHIEPLPGLESYGLIRNDGSYRPVARAYQTLVNSISGFQEVNHFVYDTHHIVTFFGLSRRTTIAWTRTDKDVLISLDDFHDVNYRYFIDKSGDKVVLNSGDDLQFILLGQDCDTNITICSVGGLPLILVEYQRCDIDSLVYQRDCSLLLSSDKKLIP